MDSKKVLQESVQAAHLTEDSKYFKVSKLDPNSFLVILPPPNITKILLIRQKFSLKQKAAIQTRNKLTFLYQIFDTTIKGKEKKYKRFQVTFFLFY